MKTCCELIGCPESALTERDKLIDEMIEVLKRNIKISNCHICNYDEEESICMKDETKCLSLQDTNLIKRAEAMRGGKG